MAVLVVVVFGERRVRIGVRERGAGEYFNLISITSNGLYGFVGQGSSLLSLRYKKHPRTAQCVPGISSKP